MSSAKWRPFCLGLNVLIMGAYVRVTIFITSNSHMPFVRMNIIQPVLHMNNVNTLCRETRHKETDIASLTPM